MTSRDLIRAGVLALFLLSGVNLLVGRLSSNSIPRQWLRRLSTEVAQRETLFMGNSVVAAGIDSTEFDRTADGAGVQGRSFNAGLGGTGPLQNLIGWRHVTDGEFRVRTVYYGGIDFFFTETEDSRIWRSLTGNNSVIFMRFPEVAAEFLGLGGAERLWFLTASRIPFFVERNSAWSRVEAFRRRLGSIGVSRKAANRFGRVEDFQVLVRRGETFRNRARNAVVGRSDLRPEVRAVLSEARSRDIRVRAILMPVHPDRRTEMAMPEWARYVEHLRGLLDQEGAELVVASDWITDPAAFTDVLHLDSRGAAEFSRLLARAVPPAPR